MCSALSQALAPDGGQPLLIEDGRNTWQIVLLNQELRFGASTSTRRWRCHHRRNSRSQTVVAHLFHVSKRAGHARDDVRPLQSRLRASDRQDGMLRIHEIIHFSIDSRLVTGARGNCNH